MSNELIHHAVMFSYYSAKTRACLSYKRIPFIEQYDGRDMNDRIRPVIHKNMIPVVEMPEGGILQDTTEIIDELEARYPDRPVMPADPVLLFVSRLVEFIMDELWISTAMNSRWNDPVSNDFVVREFGNRFGVGLPEERALKIGQGAAGRMQSYLPHLGVGDESGQKAAGAWFEASARALDRCVGPTRYALGTGPSLVDFCLYSGFFAHQYRDLGAAQTFLKSRVPGLCYYLDNLTMAQACPEARVLEMSDDFSAFLEAVGPAGAQFATGIMARTQQLLADAKSGDLMQQPIEPFTIDLGGLPLNRGGSTFSAWKSQRVRDVYDSLEGEDRRRADEIASRAGWDEILSMETSGRLLRRDYQIFVE